LLARLADMASLRSAALVNLVELRLRHRQPSMLEHPVVVWTSVSGDKLRCSTAETESLAINASSSNPASSQNWHEPPGSRASTDTLR
jgi:hypothetical protein